MPEDDPGTLVGGRRRDGRRVHPRRLLLRRSPRTEPAAADRAVAAHRPPVPQRRRRPGRQLPRPGPGGGPAAGSSGEYFTRRAAAARTRRSNRIDPQVQFDFGTGSPDPKLERARVLDPLGGLGPRPGDGRVRVHRPHRARRPAVGQRPEPAADRRLGEVRQRHRVPGVDLPARRPGLPAAAGVLEGQAGRGRLRRRTRHAAGPGVDRSAVEAAARRAGGDPGPAPVAGRRSPEAFVRRTPFPPDDRSLGWERGTAVSKEWDQATTDAAIETAGYVARPTSCRNCAGVRPGGDPADRDGRRLAAQFCPQVRRAGLPPAADRRAEAALHRPPVRGGRATRNSRSSGSCCWC